MRLRIVVAEVSAPKKRRVQKVCLSHLHAGNCEVTDCHDPSRIELYSLQGHDTVFLDTELISTLQVFLKLNYIQHAPFHLTKSLIFIAAVIIAFE
jgi:hypothetical protein